MILYEPFQISARLLPALKIGDGWLSYDKETYVFYLDTPEFEYEVNDFRPGCCHSVQNCFEDMMYSFEVAVKEYIYTSKEGVSTTYDPLFPDHVTKWLVANEDDICYMSYLLNREDLIK